MKSDKVELKIPARPEFLRVVRLLISGYVSRMDVSVDEVENLKVAVSEACNSSMQESDGNSEGTITISCWEKSGEIVVEVRDKGVKTGPDGADEDEMAERGLGFLLIQTLMDDVDISSEPGKGTKIVMKKKITAA